MATGSRFAVAIHTLAVLGYLAKHGVEKASSNQIARSVNTNPVVIRNLLLILKRAGLIRSKEGKGGGVSLACSPEKIALRDVYTAVEDSSLLNLNPNDEFKLCPVSRSMKKILPSIFNEIDEAVLKTLQKRKLSDIIENVK